MMTFVCFGFAYQMYRKEKARQNEINPV